MFLNEIDFPNKILDAIKNDSLVIFAGAGASMGKPTSLPNYEKLAAQIAEDTGKELGKDDSCEVFLGSLKAEGIDVNQQAAEILSGTCLEHNKLHEAIVDLFESPDKIKIVTTNYDQMFEHVIASRGENTVVYNAPALPLGNDVNGIIHIHGNVNNPKYMVVTDEDFGRAYLTDGYASKFIVQLFESYTVLFIGYSYNDTIMKYLTRALSRNTKNNRYILTDNRNANWSIYGIKPIYFKKGSFAVMREGLTKLGRASKKRLIEWKTQFAEIKETPPKDLSIDTEIEYCLEDYDRSVVLANSIYGKEWIIYLDQKNVFTECFSNDVEITKIGELWAEWLCNNCVGKNDESLLWLINKHANVTNQQFADLLARKLFIHDKELDTSYLLEYLLVLDKYISEQWKITRFLKNLVDREQYYAAFLLLKKLYVCNMLIERKYSFPKDSVELKHYFVGDYFHANKAWKMIKEKAIESFPYEIILFVIEKITELHTKYVLAGRASKDEEPAELIFINLEEKRDYIDDPIEVLCKMLIDASSSLANDNVELLKATVLQGLCSESPLMKKMILKVIRSIQMFSACEQLNILLSHDFLDSIDCREQVFLLTAKIFLDLSQKEKDCLIDAIEKLDEEHVDRTRTYNVYNWCVCLHEVDPDNDRINDIIRQMQQIYGFKPRKHPERIIEYSSDECSFDQSPLSVEEILKLPIPVIIDKLKNYNNDPFKGPSRRGLLNAFSSCFSKDKNWAKKIIMSLLNENVNENDVWQYVFYGLQNDNYNLEDSVYYLKLIADNIDLINNIYGASEYLWNVLKKPDMKSFFANNEQLLFSVSEVFWDHKVQEEIGLSRTMDKAYNSTIGHILFSWIQMISLRTEKDIPERYKNHFEEALKLKSQDKTIVVCILVGHFNFFCNRDMEWSKNVLMPYLVHRNKMIYANAWEGMVFFSNSAPKDTADIIAPVCYDAIKKMHWMEKETKNGFIHLLLSLMIYVIDKPTLKYIPEFYKYTSDNERRQFIGAIENCLRDMEEDHKGKWWNAWLKRFLENRKNNKPCELGDEENGAIVDLLTVLPEVFDEAVDIICKGKMPESIDDLFWYELSEMQIATKKPHSMAKFLTKALKSVSSLSLSGEDIRTIVGELNNLELKECRALNEALLRHNIDIQVC